MFLREKKILHLIFVLLGVVIFIGPAVCAEEDSKDIKDLSVTQLLEYSVHDLNARITSLIKKNRKMIQKNNALRKRIIFLRQRIREMESRKIFMLEEAMEATDVFKVEDKESQIYLDALKKGQNHLSRLRKLNIEVEQQMEDSPIRIAQMKADIKELELEIKQMEKEYKGIGKAKTTKDFKEQEYRLLKAMEQVKKRMMKKEKEIPVLELMITKVSWNKQKLIEEQLALQEKMSNTQKDLLSSQEVQAQIKVKGQIVEAERIKIEDDFSGDLGEYRKYEKLLLQQIDLAKQLTDDIEKQSQEQTKVLMNYHSQLNAEAQVLLSRAKVLGETKKLLEKYQEVLAKQETVSLKKNALQADLNEVVASRESFLKQLAEKQDDVEMFFESERKMRVQMTDLKSKLKEVDRQYAKAQKTKLYDQQRKLINEIAKTKQNIEELNQKSVAFNEEQDRLLKDLERIKSEGQEKMEKVEQLQQALQLAISQEINLNADRGRLETTGEFNLSKVKDEIGKLKLQEAIILNSVNTVKEQMNTKDMEINEYVSEKAQLKEYLTLLDDENRSLRIKVLSLEEKLKKF